MKPPKVPKGLPRKLASKAQPFVSRVPRSQPVTPISQKPLPTRRTESLGPVPSAVPEYKPLPVTGPRIADEDTWEQKAAHEAKVRRWQTWPIAICALAAFGMGMYTVQLYISLTREIPEKDIPKELIDRFDREAEGYDEKVGTAEIMLRMTARRKALTEKVHGHVLEVAVGTGRNFPYYPTKKCSTVTLLDASGPMLAVAKRKWKDEHPEYFHRVFFKQQSALDPITPPYGAQDGYDTVLQTMGLCSTSEPVKLLQNLEKATKENGQILLLEHGRSYYDWLNKLLDKTAPAHADEHGCWWNKDIGKIVEESGLDVVEIKRYNFGTTWWVELKPRKRSQPKVEAPKEGESAGGPSPVAQKPWWNIWK
ncbi:S-adenosyl-L-methionine-dependent methyltransferase [Westerdykella ornata]|uniref:S-adenosyl-L-methionine-dependent methyltransferase n=1 Tax=Westerdykella ornata TaxID=318751 RepID=A0A6A6JWQ4_WESOR|nr:S-adenosyl-L-methionine-dependent methyltransferase [Westerdykella ornata]KAF2280248.1 S-adenosyl-L-methionine-dependent methyltransferase [Westerdykella ornata]